MGIAVIDLSGLDPSTMVVPAGHGIEQAFQNWGGNTLRYPTGDQWAQFMMFFNGGTGLLIHVKDSNPAVQIWDVDATAKTLSIDFGAGATPPIEQIAISSWQQGAAIYKAWARQQYWWGKRDNPHGEPNWVFTAATNVGSVLTATSKHASSIYRSGVYNFASNYRTNIINDQYPDYTVAPGFDQAFADLRALGQIIVPYMAHNSWHMTEPGYDFENMIWHAPVAVASISNTGTDQYTVIFSSTPEIAQSAQMQLNDQFVFTDTGNPNLDGVAFTVGARITDSIFAMTGPNLGGDAVTGNGYLIATVPTLPNLKAMCLDVEANKARLESERWGIVDVDGVPTEWVYIDTVSAQNPWICHNPNHNHAAGDTSNYIANNQELIERMRGKQGCMIEGWAEPYLGQANIYLNYARTGELKPAGLINLLHHIYGEIGTFVGWKETDAPNDATLNARLIDAMDNYQVAAHGSPCQTAAMDDAVFLNKNYPTTIATLKARGDVPERSTVFFNGRQRA